MRWPPLDDIAMPVFFFSRERERGTIHPPRQDGWNGTLSVALALTPALFHGRRSQ
jgi:hypothetical protein